MARFYYKKLDVDLERLINAVKCRPFMYDKNNEMYPMHKKQTSKVWREIAEELHPNWDQASQMEKAEFALEIRKRWKNLRTCFAREIALQKKEREEKMKQDYDEPVKKRKRYEYYELLSFLLNSYSGADCTRESDDEVDPLNESYKHEVVFDYGESSKSEELHVSNVLSNYVQYENVGTTKPQAAFERSNAVENKILDMLEDIKKEGQDEDRQFILSLLPNFKNLNARKKMEAKIQILNVLKKLTYEEE